MLKRLLHSVFCTEMKLEHTNHANVLLQEYMVKKMKCFTSIALLQNIVYVLL